MTTNDIQYQSFKQLKINFVNHGENSKACDKLKMNNLPRKVMYDLELCACGSIK